MQAHMVGTGWHTQMTSYGKSSEHPKIFQRVVSSMTCTNLYFFHMPINQISFKLASSCNAVIISSRISFASTCILSFCSQSLSCLVTKTNLYYSPIS